MIQRALRIAERNIEYLRSVLESKDLELMEWSRLRQLLVEEEAKRTRLVMQFKKQAFVDSSAISMDKSPSR
jgi:hypothetical protein